MQTQSAFAKLRIGTTTKYCFVKFEDHTVWSLADASEDNICGKLDHDKEDVDVGIILPRLNLQFYASPEEVDLILPLVGTTESPADTFTPIDDFSGIDIDVVLYRGPTLDTYQNGMVDKFIIRAQKGAKPLTFELQAVFASEPIIDKGGSFTGTGVANKTAPYWLHTGSVLTLDGAETPFQSFVFVLDHHLEVQHNNSRYPTSLSPSDRTYHLGVDTPFTADTVDLITPFTGEPDASPPGDAPSATGYSGSVVFARGNQSFGINFHNLKQEVRMPSVFGKRELRLSQFFQAYGTGSTKPVTFSQDPTT